MSNNVYEYYRGTWTSIQDPMEGYKDRTIDDIAKELGFQKEAKVGDEWDLFALEVYAYSEIGHSATGHAYIVMIGNGDISCEAVYVVDFPSFLMLMKEVLPLLQATHDINRES